MHKTFLNLVFLLFCTLVTAQSDTLTIQKLMDEAYSFEQLQPKKALQLYRKTYQLSLKTNYKDGAYKSLLYSGIVHSDKGNYDSALFYYNKNIAYCIKEKIRLGEAKGYANSGNVYQFRGDYANAIKCYVTSIKIFEKTKDSLIITKSYRNLSALYTQFKNEKLEFFYLKKAELFLPKSEHIERGLLYCDIGGMLLSQKKLEEAYSYFKKAEIIGNNQNNNEVKFYSIRSIGEYYKFKNNYKKAIPFLEKALSLADQSVDVIRKIDLTYILSGAYYEDGEYLKALPLASKSLKEAQNINSKELVYKSLKRLSDIYYKLNQPQKAYPFLERSYLLKDSVFAENHLKDLTLIQTQFETEKKDKSIVEQQVKLKKQELNLIKNQKQKQLYFISIVLLVLLSFGIWYFFKQRQNLKNQEIKTLKQNQEIAKLEALIDGEEKERKRIAQELHDGLNGDLSAIKYRLSTLEDAGLSAIDSENLNKVIDMIDDSCAQVRSISHNLMPSSILEYGLIETIKQYCIKINNTDNFKIDFQSYGNYITLSKKTETVIYRIIQELVTNILKHAKATEAMVQFNFREDELFITVEDNGIGFDKTQISEGIGHKNIQTRVDFLNAVLNVDSTSNGTSYTISIDLNKVK